MTTVDLLVNGVILHVDYENALRFVRDPANWINAFPNTSGRPNGKVVPFRRHLAPIVLTDLNIVSMLPFIDTTGESLIDKTIVQFAFCAVVTLSSEHKAAIDYGVQHGTWLIERQSIGNVFWSRPAQVGAFDALLPPEARRS